MNHWCWVSVDGTHFGYTQTLKDARRHTQEHGGGIISKNADVVYDHEGKLAVRCRTTKEGV